MDHKTENWLLRLFTWLHEAKDVWITILVLALVIASSFLLFFNNEGDLWVRTAGLALELLGLGVVAKGLSDSRRLFNRPSAYEVVVSWLKRYPSIYGYNKVISGNLNIKLKGCSVHGSGGSLRVTSTSLEARIAVIEERLNHADTQINEGQRKLEEETKNRLETMDSEAKARVEGDAAVKKQLEEAVVGGILLETMGVIWLAVGVILSSLPAEIAGLFAN